MSLFGDLCQAAEDKGYTLDTMPTTHPISRRVVQRRRPSTQAQTLLTFLLVFSLLPLALVSRGGEEPEATPTNTNTAGSDTAGSDAAGSEAAQTADEAAGDAVDGVSEGTSAPDAAPAIAAAHVIRIDSAIQPVAADFIASAVRRADSEGAAVLVLELSTPGGLLTSTRSIATSLLQSQTPVVVFVAPSGAQAASAGFFILMAGDLAAMAPGTNSGAAHPVSGGGEDIQGDMRQKVEEDSAALMRSLARQRNRDIELAESAVLESKSFTAEEALEQGLIDVIAIDVRDLLQQIDGRVVTKISRGEVTLDTAKAPIVRQAMPTYQKFLAIFANPSIAALLMGLGGLGLYIEITNPGSIFPGVMGAICLILGFYAMSVLPINTAGIALVVLGLALFVFEVQVPSFGLLTLGGSLCLILGSVMLFKDTMPVLSGGMAGIVTGAVTLSLIMALLARRAWTVRRQPATTGVEGLVGEQGTVRKVMANGYKVFVHGELWRAESDDSLAEGDTVDIVAVRGLTLTLRSTTAPAACETTPPQTSPPQTTV